MQLGIEIKNVELQKQYAKVLSTLYQEAGQPELALEYYIKYDSLSAIIDNTQQTINQAMQVAKTAIAQQDATNNLEKKAFESTRKSQRIALAGAILALLTLIVLMLITYRSLRQKQRSNRTISQQAASLRAQNQVIDRALKAKELMLKETHHRIKNNLQLISSLLELQVASMDDERAGNALRTAQRRIQSIAIVHSKLYGSSDDELIELSEFVSDLFIRLASAFGHNESVMKFNNEIPTTHLPLHIVVLLGLILNELITNTFKHAYDDIAGPAITIALTTSGNDYTLEYIDNGAALPQGMFDRPTGSLGLLLIKRMSTQLKGTANYTYDGRNRFTISFSFRAGS